MSSEYIFTTLSTDQWDWLVASSPQGTIFNSGQFLQSLGSELRFYGVVEGEDLLAGVSIQLDELGLPVGPTKSFGLYQGILLSSKVEGLPDHSRSRKVPEVVLNLLEGITAIYSEMWLGLHWSLRDLRGVQWFNYHLPEKGQFELELRYTGTLDLGSFKSKNEMIKTFSQGRKSDYKKALSNGIAVSVSDDIEILDTLHALTFSRQEAQRGIYEYQLTSIALSALSRGFGEMLVARLPSGDPVSASLFVWDSLTSYYLFGANDPVFRNTGAATLVIAENLGRAQNRGIRSIDFVGINSPQRGDFKTSFNAIPKPYFDAHWHRPEIP